MEEKERARRERNTRGGRVFLFLFHPTVSLVERDPVGPARNRNKTTQHFPPISFLSDTRGRRYFSFFSFARLLSRARASSSRLLLFFSYSSRSPFPSRALGTITLFTSFFPASTRTLSPLTFNRHVAGIVHCRRPRDCKSIGHQSRVKLKRFQAPPSFPFGAESGACTMRLRLLGGATVGNPNGTTHKKT